MKYYFIFLFILGCSHAPKPEHHQSGQDLVSVNAALNQAQASYLRGCVEAMKTINIPVAYPGCYDKSIIHRQELDQIMAVEVE